MDTIDIRKKISLEEFDYQTLISLLSEYKNPKMKINALLRSGDIIRVKKGLYIFGENYRYRPYSRELLANLIYGPSIVSLEYMLSYYGLIPEAVQNITSVTFKRPKNFITPIGSFIYRQVPKNYYHLGIQRLKFNGGVFLAAGPERALADKIREDRGNIFKNQKEAERYLFDDLRLDQEVFEKLDLAIFQELALAARSRKINFCAEILKRKQGSR